VSINGTRDTPTSSPCRGKCTTCYGGDFCKGCGRTVAQIRDWNTYTDQQKIAVKAESAARVA
jgi:predicted Fe-S protein YdhL (DUF1289 family)